MYVRDQLQLSALLCHRHWHGPHLVGVASGALGERCKTCLCARSKAPRRYPPRVDAPIRSSRKELFVPLRYQQKPGGALSPSVTINASTERI